MRVSELLENTEGMLPEKVVAYVIGKAFAAVFKHLEEQNNSDPTEEKIQYFGRDPGADAVGMTQLVFQYGPTEMRKAVEKLFRYQLRRHGVDASISFNRFTWSHPTNGEHHGLIVSIWGHNLISGRKGEAFLRGLGMPPGRLQHIT